MFMKLWISISWWFDYHEVRILVYDDYLVAEEALATVFDTLWRGCIYWSTYHIISNNQGDNLTST